MFTRIQLAGLMALSLGLWPACDTQLKCREGTVLLAIDCATPAPSSYRLRFSDGQGRQGEGEVKARCPGGTRYEIAVSNYAETENVSVDVTPVFEGGSEGPVEHMEIPVTQSSCERVTFVAQSREDASVAPVEKDGAAPSTDADTDSVISMPPGDAGCAGGTHLCGNVCVRDDDANHCGSRCDPCGLPANGLETSCVGGACRFTCQPTHHECDGQCVSNNAPATCGTSCNQACPLIQDGTPTCDGTKCGGACGAGKKQCALKCIPNASPCNEACPQGTHDCSGSCQPDDSVSACGATCVQCPQPAGSVAKCTGGQCSFMCSGENKQCGNKCIGPTQCCTQGDCAARSGATATCNASNDCIYACQASHKVCGSNICVPNSTCCAAAGDDCGVPTIVSVSPTDGAKGVASNAVIVVKFSKAMNRRSVELAYESSALPANAVTFSWAKDGSSDRDVLTVTPKQPLVYAKGESVNSAAQSYAFTIKSSALDLWGVPVNTFVWGFTTLRDLSLACSLQANLSGSAQAPSDVDPPTNINAFLIVIRFSNPTNVVSKAGITFDCALPFSLEGTLTSATLTAYQKVVNSWAPPDGALFLHSASFADLASMHNPCGQSTGIRFSESASLGYRTADVTAMVRDDFAARSSRSNKSQYCLQFTRPNDSNVQFSAPAESMAPSLKVSVVAP